MTLKVYYVFEDNCRFAIYRKSGIKNWRKIPVTKVETHHQIHDVTSRSKIINGEFVTISPVQHYFCYIETLQLDTSCISVEQAIVQSITQNFTGIEIVNVFLPN